MGKSDFEGSVEACFAYEFSRGCFSSRAFTDHGWIIDLNRKDSRANDEPGGSKGSRKFCFI